MTSAQKTIDAARFVDGVIFPGKLFGVEDVKDDKGDDVCNTSMVKLKALVKAKKEHKPQILIKITLEGIEILDQTTKEVMHKHAVECISYIARDPTDEKAFGYIFKNDKNQLQYIGLSHKPSSEIVLALKDLFEVVYELKTVKKDQEKENLVKAQATVASNVTNNEPQSGVASIVDTNIPTSEANVIETVNNNTVQNVANQFDQSLNLNASTPSAKTDINSIFDDTSSSSFPPSNVVLQPQVNQPNPSSDILLLFDAPKPVVQAPPAVFRQESISKVASSSDLLDISLDNVDKFYEIQKNAELFSSPIVAPTSVSPVANPFFSRPPPMVPKNQQTSQVSNQVAYSPFGTSQFTTVPQNSPINPSNLQNVQRNMFPPLNNQPFGYNSSMQSNMQNPMQQQMQNPMQSNMQNPMQQQMLNPMGQIPNQMGNPMQQPMQNQWMQQMQPPQQQQQQQQQQNFQNNQYQW